MTLFPSTHCLAYTFAVISQKENSFNTLDYTFLLGQKVCALRGKRVYFEWVITPNQGQIHSDTGMRWGIK